MQIDHALRVSVDNALDYKKKLLFPMLSAGWAGVGRGGIFQYCLQEALSLLLRR